MRFADPETLEKATVNIERFREILSDPLNLLIDRDPAAGYLDNRNKVILHNGNRVQMAGEYAYYGDFSHILIINRGVHEPLEEYCFQQTLKRIEVSNPTMIELGSYWAHYSMWLKRRFPGAACVLVEPDAEKLKCGQFNFAQNGFAGDFVKRAVADDDLKVDELMREKGIERLSILHSDIQGHEAGMLRNAENALSGGAIDYLFISTHSEEIHSEVLNMLAAHGYRTEVSSPYDTHTTSFDGFVLAASRGATPVFDDFRPLGRVDILNATPSELVRSIAPAVE